VTPVRYHPDEDYYELFGIPPTATPEEIARAHKRLAKDWHPDLHPDKEGATERFQRISEAYTVLKDPVTKGEYDRQRWAEVARDKGRAPSAESRRFAFRKPPRRSGHVDPQAHHRDRYMGYMLLAMELITLGLFLFLGVYAAWRKLHG
jgi:curved DNA-binding protein CbpA